MIGIRAFGDYDVQISLVDMCKNTIKLIFDDEDLMAKLIEFRDENGGTLTVVFYYKLGSDGSGDQPIFKQALDEERDLGAVYASGMVVMQIVAKMSDGRNEIIYNNSLVNSSLSWRPLRLLFKKETTAIIKEEYERLFGERQELKALNYELVDGVSVDFKGNYSLAELKVQCLIIYFKGEYPLAFSRTSNVGDSSILRLGPPVLGCDPHSQ